MRSQYINEIHFFTILGPIIFMTIMFFSSRTIRKLILHKGGEKVTLVTYNIIPGQQIFTESLENVKIFNCYYIF